jgi:Flp pilus assembly protein TadD
MKSNCIFTAAVLSILILTTSCVRRTTIGDSFGLPGKLASRPPDSKARATPPNEALRSIFHQQTQDAFNPLTDDRRLQTLQALLKLNPQDVASRLELARIYENYRLCDEGFDQYVETLQQARSALEASAKLAEQAVLGLGRCSQTAGRTRQAIPLLEAFIGESPTASSWNELGLLYNQIGDLTAGENAFREAVALNAESNELHNNLGYNLLLQNKAEAAEGEFRRALTLNPKSATTHNNLGVVLAHRGDLQGALEQFQVAADAATAHNNLAVVLLETGQYEQSRAELLKALAIRHYFAPALANFKLVQERIREQGAQPKAGHLTPTAPTTTVAQSKDSEDR